MGNVSVTKKKLLKLIAKIELLDTLTGVSWFTRMAAAMGEDPGAVYRQCITSLGQQEALRPPYNHASRQEVGLKQDWSVHLGHLASAHRHASAWSSLWLSIPLMFPAKSSLVPCFELMTLAAHKC